MSQPELILQNQILVALGHFSNVMVWTNRTGVGRALSDPDRVVSYGLKGSADILGVRRQLITEEMVGLTVGQALAIEVKTKVGRQREQQKKFQQAFVNHGGIYILARSVEDATSAVASVPGATR